MKHLILVSFLIITSNLEAQTQAEMNKSAYESYLESTQELSTVYSQLYEIVGEKEKQMLSIAQNDWIDFRKSQCKFQVEQYDMGSIQPLMYSACLEELTRERIAQLKSIIDYKNR